MACPGRALGLVRWEASAYSNFIRCTFAGFCCGCVVLTNRILRIESHLRAVAFCGSDSELDSLSSASDGSPDIHTVMFPFCPKDTELPFSNDTGTGYRETVLVHGTLKLLSYPCS